MITNNKISYKFKRILVTGGAGFIGSHLINSLLLNTSSFIFNIDKLGYASDNNRIKKDKFQNRYKLFQINLCNIEDVKEVIEISNPDAIIHLAAESHVDRSIKSPIDFFESNIKGTYNLLEAVRSFWDNLPSDKRKIFRFIHISTDEVYGSLGKHGKFSEETPYKPRSPYSASKAASDHIVSAWNHTYGIPTLVTNCSNNYGPYQFPEKLIPLAIFKAINKEKIPIYGNGLNIRDWLYVEDHIDGILKVLTNGLIGKTYCIGGYGEITNIEIIRKICTILNKLNSRNSFKYENLIEFVDDRPGHDKRYSIDSQLITKELGWYPKYNLEEGLLMTVKWYLENINWCKKILNRNV